MQRLYTGRQVLVPCIIQLSACPKESDMPFPLGNLHSIVRLTINIGYWYHVNTLEETFSFDQRERATLQQLQKVESKTKSKAEEVDVSGLAIKICLGTPYLHSIFIRKLSPSWCDRCEAVQRVVTIRHDKLQRMFRIMIARTR